MENASQGDLLTITQSSCDASGSSSMIATSTSTTSTTTTSASPATTTISCPTGKPSFTKKDASDAIDDFCDDLNGQRAYVLNAGKSDNYNSAGEPGVQMGLFWASNQQGCQLEKTTTVTQDQCTTYFQLAAAACEGQGAEPLTWNSPNGCISFYFFGCSSNC